mmetsp:Transcript_30372/g.49041  ORF Transcript_30372/g.49041 Transcript_30372/m.49041 type:complete len:234 (+) Transcript_30372:317-1018(+)
MARLITIAVVGVKTRIWTVCCICSRKTYVGLIAYVVIGVRTRVVLCSATSTSTPTSTSSCAVACICAFSACVLRSIIIVEMTRIITNFVAGKFTRIKWFHFDVKILKRNARAICRYISKNICSATSTSNPTSTFSPESQICMMSGEKFGQSNALISPRYANIHCGHDKFWTFIVWLTGILANITHAFTLHTIPSTAANPAAEDLLVFMSLAHPLAVIDARNASHIKCQVRQRC